MASPASTAERLPVRHPFDGDGLLDFLGRRAVPGVEERVDGTFRRSLRLVHGAGVVELTPTGAGVDARFDLDDERDRPAAVAKARRLLDLDAEPDAVDSALGGDPALGPLVRRHPGRRSPGTVDGAELAVRAVLGQQVSVAGARALAGRLVQAAGEPLRRPVGGVTHLFPTTAALAELDLPMPASRARALRALAAARVPLDPDADRQESVARLLALPGIGPWTAAYVAMRALGDPDVFLAGDLGVRHGLDRLGATVADADRWRPWRSYATHLLWAA